MEAPKGAAVAEAGAKAKKAPVAAKALVAAKAPMAVKAPIAAAKESPNPKDRETSSRAASAKKNDPKNVTDPRLQRVLETAKGQGGKISYAEVNQLLGEEFLEPERVEDLFIELERHGVRVIDDPVSEAADIGLADEVAATTVRDLGAVRWLEPHREDRRPGPHVPHPDG